MRTPRLHLNPVATIARRPLMLLVLAFALAVLLPSTASANTAPQCWDYADSPTSIDKDTKTPVYLSCWDSDGDPLEYTVSQPTNGSLGAVTVSPWDESSSTVEYTPNQGYVGSDSFAYKVTDGTSTTESTRYLNVVAPEPPSCYEPLAVSVRTNTSKSLWLGCWSSSNAGAVSYSVTSQPKNGTVVFSTDGYGAATYTPKTDFEGSDSFTYKATNSAGSSSEVTQAIEVSPTVNNLPSCSSPTATTRSGSPKTISLYCGDPDGDPLTLKTLAGEGPANGTLSAITQPSGHTMAKVTYTSNADFVGTDQFTFAPNDTFGDGPAATATLDVKASTYNTAPTCFAQYYEPSVEAGSSTFLSPSCSDAEDDPLTYEIVGQPSQGTVTQESSTYDGQTHVYFKYTANGGATGTDSFTYRASDGRDVSAPAATLTVKITAPQAPTCSEPSALTVRTNSAGKSIWGNCWSSTGTGSVTYEVVKQPAHGTVNMTEWGSMTYVPNTDYAGADSFSYRAKNSVGTSNEVTQAITVSPDANEKPLCYGDQTATHMRTDTTKKLYLSCWDADNDPLTYEVVDGKGPANGTLSAITQPSTSWQWAGSASVTYTPNSGYTGDDAFEYIAKDGRSSSTAVVEKLTVHEKTWNTVPSCYSYNDNTYEVETGTTSWIHAECHDDQDDPITYSVVDQPTNGTVTRQSDTSGDMSWSTFRYTPKADYLGTDSFTYKANDGLGDSLLVKVNITVVPPKPPQCFPFQSTITVRPEQQKSLWLSCWGTSGGGAVTYEITKQPTNGTVTFPWGTTSGSVIYTANKGYSGTDSFSYRARNSAGTSTTVTQSIKVDPNHNSVPQCWGGTDATRVRSGESKDAFLHCYDADNDPLTYSIVPGKGPTKGTLGAIAQPAADTPFASGKVRYTPNDGATGSDAFTFKASDGRGSSGEATHGVTILAADHNTAPTCWSSTIPLRVAQNATLQLDQRMAPCWDAEGDALTYSLVSGPTHGTLSAPDAQGIRTYTPKAGFVGKDSFSAKASDGRAESQTITFEVTVTEATKLLTEPVTSPTGSTVPVQNYVDESTGESFITVPTSSVQQFANACMPLTLSTEINPGTGTVSDVKLVLKPTNGGETRRYDMTGGDPSAKSNWSATIDCIVSGDVSVEYNLTEDGVTVPIVRAIGGIVLIDPQGIVHDAVQYDAAIAAGKTPAEARAAAALTGAKVVLQRKDDGVWRKVLSGDPGISPNVNPQYTGKDGLYQWDVAEGTYRVIVSKEGYETVTSRTVIIGDPVLDLHIPMHKVKTTTPGDGQSGGGTNTGGTTGGGTTDGGTTGGTTGSGTTGSGTTGSGTTGSGTTGSGTSGGGTTGGTTGSSGGGQLNAAGSTAKPACFGLTGLSRATCLADEHLKQALAKCDAQKGAKRALCTKVAKADHKRAAALAKCDTVAKKKRAGCVKAAKLAHKKSVAVARCGTLKGGRKSACVKKAKALRK